MSRLTRIIFTSSLLSLVLIVSGATQAGVNPFKKSKNYNFGTDVPWYESEGSAIKSGSIRDGSDTNYYHLNVDKHRLLLRLGKNDPSGQLVGTRVLDVLAITDVIIDGRQMPVFGWCLKNQQSPGKKLKQNSLVANDMCVNSGGAGDFVINLDDKSRSQLKKAKKIEFVVEPYGRPVKLTYSMGGYSGLMAKINKPAPIVKKTVEAKPKKKAKAKPKVVVKPKVVAKPKPKSRSVKICNATPPSGYKTRIGDISYPCNDADKKSAAEASIAAKVDVEKKRAETRIIADDKKPKKAFKREAGGDAEWDKKQAVLWMSRCERHWKKGASPCYCEKYLDKAPSGVVNTCKK